MRLGDSKMIERLAVLRLAPAFLVADYVLANAVLGGLHLLVPLALVTGLGQPDLVVVPWVLIYYITGFVAANAIGVLVALMADSSGEMHLYVVLTVLAVGGVSGLFVASMPGPLRDVAFLLPFGHLADALLHAWGTSYLRLPPLAPLSGGALWCVGLFLSPCSVDPMEGKKALMWFQSFLYRLAALWLTYPPAAFCWSDSGLWYCHRCPEGGSLLAG